MLFVYGMNEIIWGTFWEWQVVLKPCSFQKLSITLSWWGWVPLCDIWGDKKGSCSKEYEMGKDILGSCFSCNKNQLGNLFCGYNLG